MVYKAVYLYLSGLPSRWCDTGWTRTDRGRNSARAAHSARARRRSDKLLLDKKLSCVVNRAKRQS